MPDVAIVPMDAAIFVERATKGPVSIINNLKPRSTEPEAAKRTMGMGEDRASNALDAPGVFFGAPEPINAGG